MSAPAPLLVVVRRLRELRDRVVFVGGMIRGLLITDPGAPPERPTDDVDLIVELSSTTYHRLAAELRSLGFREDTTPGAPICRWIVEGVRVDVMPTEGGVLGFRNRWYADAMARAIEVHADGERFRIIDAPHFCATKLDAHSDRGAGDMYHHDLEDVIAVVDGRLELCAEFAATSIHLRRYVAAEFRRLLGTPAFLEALPGHLPGDAASQARLPLLCERLEALASLR